MSFILNLIGPPGAGKSTFASKFVLEYPEFKYCTIDEYRIEYENESLAWQKMLEDAINHKYVIIESCGLSYRLNHIFNSETVRRRPIYTINFDVDDIKILQKRLQNRCKRSVPLPQRIHNASQPNNVNISHELQAAYWFMNNLQNIAYPIDYTVYTNQYESENEYYQTLVNIINAARIDSLKYKGRRNVKYVNKYLTGFAEL